MGFLLPVRQQTQQVSFKNIFEFLFYPCLFFGSFFFNEDFFLYSSYIQSNDFHPSVWLFFTHQNVNKNSIILTADPV